MIGWRCWSVLALVVSLLAASEMALGTAVFFLFFVLPHVTLGPDGVSKSIDLMLRIPAPAARPRDAEGQLCEAASFFLHHYKALWIRTPEATRSFDSACRRQVASLDREARAELDELLRHGAITQVLPPEAPNPEGGHADDWRTCGARFRRKTEEELEGEAQALHAKKGVLPLREFVVDASEVRQTLERAEVARFDARGLLPARMFNVSLPELSALHPGADVELHATSDSKHGIESSVCIGLLAALIPGLTVRGPGSLLEWLLTHGLMKAMMRWICDRFWTLKEVSARMHTFERSSFSPAFGREEAMIQNYFWQQGMTQGRSIGGSNINSLRLPNWTRGELDVQSLTAKLGLAGQVEHAHNLLWLGASPGGIHSDIQDNVLVQISGVSDVFVVPANCSLTLSLDLSAAFTPVNADWILEQGPDFPFFLVTLRPGDGLVIPSNAMHTVASRDPGRIGMNFFFEPRYGQMQWPTAPANYYTYASKGRLAMRLLWAKSVKEMWDSKDAGAPSFIIHGQRQELV